MAFSLRKPTALFRKMGTRIFFLKHSLVIRKIRVPLCSNVRNLFVEQSAHSLIPQQNRISSIYEDDSPWNISRKGPRNARKKAVLAPFASWYSLEHFVEQCSTNVPRNLILCSTMIISRLTKTDCATKFRGTLCSTPLFSMFHGMFHDTMNLI